MTVRSEKTFQFLTAIIQLKLTIITEETKSDLCGFVYELLQIVKSLFVPDFLIFESFQLIYNQSFLFYQMMKIIQEWGQTPT